MPFLQHALTNHNCTLSQIPGILARFVHFMSILSDQYVLGIFISIRVLTFHNKLSDQPVINLTTLMELDANPSSMMLESSTQP